MENRRARHRWVLIGTFALGLTSLPNRVDAQWVVSDPLNLAQNVIQVVKTVQQINQQRMQIQYQLQALRKLRNPNWREIDSHVRQMEYLLEQGEAIGYTVRDMDRQFRQVFPGYQAAATILALPDAQRLQARRTLGTMRAALNVLNAHAQQFRAGQQKLAQIKGQMAGVDGTQEALELQATMDAFMAEEVGLLRQAVATQANLQAVYNAYQVSQQEEMRASYRAMMDRMSTLPPPSRRNFSLQVRP